MKRDIPSHGQIGFEDAGQGSALILLHAFPFDRRMWRPQIVDFSASHRVVAPDLRGFGESEGWNKAPCIGQMADDVRALLDDLHIDDPITLCGLSMGGYVALAFARMFPRRLKALILSDTRAEADSPEALAKRGENIAFASTHTAREFVERTLPGQISNETKTQCPNIVNELTQIGASQNPQGIIHGLQALRDRHDATGELKNIEVPTLVLGGRDDAITPPEVLESLANGIPGSQLHIIEGAGHLANIEKADEWNEQVKAFLHQNF